MGLVDLVKKELSDKEIKMLNGDTPFLTGDIKIISLDEFSSNYNKMILRLRNESKDNKKTVNCSASNNKLSSAEIYKIEQEKAIKIDQKKSNKNEILVNVVIGIVVLITILIFALFALSPNLDGRYQSPKNTNDVEKHGYVKGFDDFHANKGILIAPYNEIIWIYFEHYGTIHVEFKEDVDVEWGDYDGSWVPLYITYQGKEERELMFSNSVNNEIFYVKIVGNN